jgi:propanediol utilization protein
MFDLSGIEGSPGITLVSVRTSAMRMSAGRRILGQRHMFPPITATAEPGGVVGLATAHESPS